VSSEVKRVLFVDDNPQFLDLTQEIISRLAGATWEIHTAQNVGQAMNMIAEKRIDLVVLDVLMPVVDGMQFLSLLNRKHPNVLKAVLTGDATEMHRTICMSRGAELFLAKPQADSEWQVIFDSLNGIGRYQPQEGFRGVLRRVGLQDVLQMECLSRNSATLEITTKELRGLIYILEGQIVHAEAGDRSGTEAFNFLMGLTGGEFAQKPYVNPPQQTITDSWEFLLMEAARKRDETFGPDDPLFADTQVIPQFGPASAQEQWQPPVAPSPLHARRQVQPPPESQTQFFTRPPVPDLIDSQRPEVTEFIVVSSQGDLIYDWQCHDVNARVNFLEFLSQKARLLSQGLPMGQFERLEVFGSKSRIITQLENDHAVFVRSNVAPDKSVVGDVA
jgi:CheY-like chemotaxis protein